MLKLKVIINHTAQSENLGNTQTEDSNHNKYIMLKLILNEENQGCKQINDKIFL